MENFNRVLSFLLGLIVVVVFVIVLSNRLNLKKKFIPFQSDNKTTVTPTPTPAGQKKDNGNFFSRLIKRNPTATPTPATVAKGGASEVTSTPPPVKQPAIQTPPQAVTGGTKPVTQIPSTGAPTLLIPIAIFSFFAGQKLRKSGKS